ncbi:MAG TPA: site-2 protease family protein [Bryobacteraceae bacterium]|nr:site-2 protease family protein [Bryobacteraceae bacterium]
MVVASWKVGRILGVELGLHYSWALIALWVFAALAAQFYLLHPDWENAVLWASTALTTILFFASLIAHELAHAAVANRHGVRVRSITLFALGGVAQADREPPTAASEFSIAIAGPIASFLIGVGSLATAFATGWVPGDDPASPAVSIPVWLGYINIWLAIFNLVPAYPLDGGRVLRAAVWRFTGNRERSLRIAAQAGRAAAIAFIALGVFRFATGGGAGSLWLAVIGWFILDAAKSSYAHGRVLEALRGVRVRDLMVRDCPRTGEHANLRDLIIMHMTNGGVGVCLLVQGANGPVGMITAHELRHIPRQQWPYRTAADVMLPLDEAQAIAPDTLVTDALEHMGRENLAQVAVAVDGQLEGIFSRSSVLGFLQSRAH